MNLKQELGKFGEDIAVKYLISKNYLIINRNFSCRQGEIDIIAKDKHQIVFIEVKTRTSLTYGKPVEAVDKNKVKHIYGVAMYYLYLYNLENCFVRFDVIEVYLHNKKIKINHIKQIM